jgi:hypothetical protein
VQNKWLKVRLLFSDQKLFRGIRNKTEQTAVPSEFRLFRGREKPLNTISNHVSEEKNPQNSVPNHFSEEKNHRNSVPNSEPVFDEKKLGIPL